jgi:hypothetical protein
LPLAPSAAASASPTTSKSPREKAPRLYDIMQMFQRMQG